MEDPSINYTYLFIVIQFFEWHVNFLEILLCYHQNYFTELERLQIYISQRYISLHCTLPFAAQKADNRREHC